MRMHLAPSRPSSAPDARPTGLLQRCARAHACACGRASGPTGACAACRRTRSLGLQPKLRVNRPGDCYEREADRIAEAVTGGAAPSAALRISPLVQRSGGAESGVTAPPAVHAALAAPGRPLDRLARAALEPRLGSDLGGVRVHTGGTAARAAEAVQAQAFTVGRDVVFGAGAYRPGTAEGKRLLTHELVHVVQQSGGRTLQRQPSPDAGVPSPDAEVPSPDAEVPSPDAVGPPTVAEAAARAENACDLSALCSLRFSNPDVVTEARVRTAALRCRPGVPFTGSPCFSFAILNPGLMLPPGPAAGSGSRAAPTQTTPGAAPPAAGLPDLSTYTQFEFALGDAAFKVDLPSSATAKLPVALRGAFKITFELVAKSSGAFAFSIVLDGIPHVQIKAGATLDAAKKSVSGELSISSTAKTCHAPSPQATKDALQKAGDKLKTAIESYGKPFEPGADEGFEQTKRLAEVVSGIVGVHQAVEKAKESCKATSVFSFGITGQAPLDPRADDALPATITVGPTFRF